MIRVSYFDEIVERARRLALRPFTGNKNLEIKASADALEIKCKNLLSARGEASGAKLASEILELYEQCGAEQRARFFDALLAEFDPDKALVSQACMDFLGSPDAPSMAKLTEATESPRQEMFRRLNQAPGGTAALVSMRSDLLDQPSSEQLKPVNLDFLHLFRSWFNRDFLTMEAITWFSPAVVLERLIKYEAVHEIAGWDDLKNRLAPVDRRCYGFFHPALVDDPLIFVEVALLQNMPTSVQGILSSDRDVVGSTESTTAVFYSINNCQVGLRGVSFGDFLIKQVVQQLQTELPHLQTFVTLSPIPGLAKWLKEDDIATTYNITPEELRKLSEPNWNQDAGFESGIRERLLSAAVCFLCERHQSGGKPKNAVARFHLGNGARLENLQWQADISERGIASSFGIMANYLYELSEIEKNHEAFSQSGEIIMSPKVESRMASLKWKKHNTDMLKKIA